MTPDQTEKLKCLISEYSASLTRSDAERELQGAIAERAQKELMIEKKHFTAVAKAHYKDDLQRQRQAAIDQADLFELVVYHEEREQKNDDYLQPVFCP